LTAVTLEDLSADEAWVLWAFVSRPDGTPFAPYHLRKPFPELFESLREKGVLILDRKAPYGSCDGEPTYPYALSPEYVSLRTDAAAYVQTLRALGAITPP
jgi:hypothetical protein